MVDTELKKLIEQSAGETRRHFDVVADGLTQKIQLVAEGVTANGQRMDRLEHRIDGVEVGIERVEQRMAGVEHRMDGLEQRIGGLDQRIGTEFEELRSMIRLSYTEIDRRLRTLEETVSILQARMDRLESGSTQ